MADHFPKGSVIRKVNNEPAIMFGAGRALLLQLAHPAVAQGVQDHSEFKKNPFKRLQGTLEATYAVVFGSDDLARGVGRRIQWIHEFVVGPGYTANDPENLLWVHATLCDTALRCYEDAGRGPAARRGGDLLPGDEASGPRVRCRSGAPARNARRLPRLHGLDGRRDRDDRRRQGPGRVHPRPLAPARPARAVQAAAPPAATVHSGLAAGLVAQPARRRVGTPASRLGTTERSGPSGACSASLPRPVRTSGNLVGGPILLWMAARHVRQFEEKQRARTADSDRTAAA